MGHETDRHRSARAALAALAAALLCLATAAPALAAGPFHTRAKALDISGFNHACGAAVDSESDVYVSSAGESKIRIFDPAHTELTFIANANEPCGLAVDSKGKLCVSEAATGNVVCYEPNAYPFSGTPTYGAPTTIDSSGEAKGIAVDPFDDRLYVAQGTRIDSYNASGTLGENEEQQVRLSKFVTGGTFTLSFGVTAPTTTVPIAFNAPGKKSEGAGSVEEALEGLGDIGPGDVSVNLVHPGPSEGEGSNYFVTFAGALGSTDVAAITTDPSGLEGEKSASVSERTKGFTGRIGEGDLTNATGVAVYTYKVTNETADRYVFVADAAADEIKLFGGPDIRQMGLRKTIDGPKPGEDFGFGTAGAYLAVDPGNGIAEGKCAEEEGEQACTAGHLLVYDEAHKAVDELEANGEFLDQFTDPAFADAKPTALAVDRSGGAGDGTIYVASGAGSGAKLLAFGPLAPPSRAPLPELSRVLTSAQAVATDPFGDIYVAAGSVVHVYGPDGVELKVGPEGKGIPNATGEKPKDLAVDSACNLYILLTGKGFTNPAEYKVQDYKPEAGACPPKDGTQYSGPVTVATGNSFQKPATITAIGINPANDHVFVLGVNGKIIELGSAAEGSPIKNPCFACTLTITAPREIAVYGANGDVYVPEQFGKILVIDPTGTEVLTRITGAGSPKGPGLTGAIAVDQSNGHVLVFRNGRGVAEEYEASGAFVAQFAFPEPKGFSTDIQRSYGIAIDNSGGPTDGNAYVAFDDTKADTPDLWAFGPLTYGEAPVEPEEFKLTVKTEGSGTGTVTATGIACPGDCSEVYEEGTEVTLSATPEAESLFSGWSGSGCSGTGACEVTMSEAKEVTASFAPAHTLSLHHEGSGEGSVQSSPAGIEACAGDCEAAFETGKPVTLIASPAPGSIFTSWKKCDSVEGRICKVTMSAAKTVGAKFSKTYDVTVKKATGNTGLGAVSGVTCDASCTSATAAFLEGKEAKLVPKASKGSAFAEWSSCPGSVEGTTCKMTSAGTAEAKFTAIPKFSLTVDKKGGGQGTVKSTPASINCGLTCSTQASLFYKGTPIELTASVTAGKGSSFAGFSGGTGSASGCSTSTSPCLFTLEATSSVTAKFE